MHLLHWCSLLPHPPSGLAAVRFAAPIRVSSIRVFPTGAQPFSESPGIIARTEPDAFFLDVFFNAHPIHPIPPSESKEKQRAPNALIPTVIAYAGGQVDFTVDMGTEYATRLMIVKGKFEALSMAIYGDVVSEPPLSSQPYTPRPLPVTDPLPLSKAVDPSNSRDPTVLAQQLLALIPDSPPLALVIRLMFCLKPSNEDWDLPEFPYLHADLETEEEDFDLESAIHLTSKPVRDDTQHDSLSNFAANVAEHIGPKSSEQSYYVAKLLSISASQHPGMARTLLQHLDIMSIFDPQTLDETTVLRLLEAATNIDIARHLNNQDFLDMLQAIQDSTGIDKHTQVAAQRLATRVKGWTCFEDALSNTRGDFDESVRLLQDIGTDENSTGIWLESMIIHDDLVTKLGENPVLPVAQSHPPLLLRNSVNAVSHADFIVFVRAYIGVASVLAVWAWTDSLGNDSCREQALAVLRLWQGVDGYREIVNHLLLLRQLTRRLEWITTDNDPPRKSGVLAEQVLVDLAKDPQAILRDDLVKTILSLKPPLSFITEDERLLMRKLALVAEDGLPAAVEELTFSSDHPLSLRRLCTLRVSLAIVDRELGDDQGEWRTLQALWSEQSHGLVPQLVDILIGVAGDLNGHFVLMPPPRMNQPLAEQLFCTADDLLRLIARLSPAYPPTSRGLRDLTAAVADVFACTDAADMLYAQSSSACVSAQRTRQTCLDLVRSFSGPECYADPGKPGAEIILRALLEHRERSGGRDPAYHLLQVFTMIDHILPDPHSVYDDGQPTHWVLSVLPNVLGELKAFFRLLDPENKVHLVKRLIKLDNGVTGIGEWLLGEELKHLSHTLDSLAGQVPTEGHRLVGQHELSLLLHFIFDLVRPLSSASKWFSGAISSIPDLSHSLSICLMSLLDGHYISSSLTQLIPVLASNSRTFDPELRFTVLLSVLRAMQSDSASSDSILDILDGLPPTAIAAEPLRLEIGRTFAAFAEHPYTLGMDTSDILLSILEWVVRQDTNPKLTTLSGVTPSAFAQVCDAVMQNIAPNREAAMTNVLMKITADEDEYFSPAAVELPDTLELPMQGVEDLLRAKGLTPSTPKTPPKAKTPDILGLVISPPTALLRSPAATGLTKTYANNDFRQLRQVPSARQNTSRLPSMHVDVGINGHLT